MHVIYPGSFDPPTFGHMAVVERAARLFDRVTIVVANNPDKSYWLSENDRLDLFRSLVSRFDNIDVVAHGGLVVELAKKLGAEAIVKGLRSESDYRLEQVMEEVNSVLGHGLETLFLMARGDLQTVSSSLVRQVYQLGGDVSHFVPELVESALSKSGLKHRE
jgi:pantetheine-phosphate adenylyltransferase